MKKRAISFVLVLASLLAMVPAAYAADYTFTDRYGSERTVKEGEYYFMAFNQIINGVGDNKFAPANTTSAQEANHYANATREQALAIAVRMVENFQ